MEFSTYFVSIAEIKRASGKKYVYDPVSSKSGYGHLFGNKLGFGPHF